MSKVKCFCWMVVFGIILAVSIAVALGGCAKDGGLFSAKLGRECVHCVIPEEEFWRKMSQGYKKTIPDQDNYSCGYCAVEGEMCPMFCWKDKNGQLNVVFDSCLNFPGNKEILQSYHPGIDWSVTQSNCWIEGQSTSTFTYLPLKYIPDDSMNMLKQAKMQLWKRCGIRYIEVPPPQR